MAAATRRAVAAVALAAPLTAKMPPASSSEETRYGAIAVPRELKACTRVRRKCERAGGPSAAASGFAATCRMVMPAAITNNATSTIAKVSKCVASGTMRQPAIMTASATTMALV